MTNEIKLKLKEKSKLYRKFVKNNFDRALEQQLKDKMTETSDLIVRAKEKHYKTEGNKLLDPSLGPKRYWSILKSFLSKKKIPAIPPLFENGLSTLNMK